MIYYIGYYNCEQNSHEDRAVSPAAVNKMNYLISALEETGAEDIEIVSPAETRKHTWIRGKKKALSKRVTLKTFPSVSSKYRLIRVFGHLVTKICFLFYLLTHVSAADQMVVYHSLLYMRIISLIKKVKKCSLIMEVEEIYADVMEDMQLRTKEIDFLQRADKYIFITDMLQKEVQAEKDFAIFHGTYRVVPDYGFSFEDGRTHVVYAGTFHPIKGGVFQAISAGEYLDESYVLHILGGGSLAEIQNVQSKISEVSQKSKCEIRYDGYKSGEKFDAFIQACHIGLSTQQADAKFSSTSFPSKILMYMSNGIHVVSVRIPAVETSSVGSCVFYYDEQSAESIADAIYTVPREVASENKRILNSLHAEFVYDLGQLLRG